MLKSFKTEINPTPEQRAKINRTIGTCRYVYNFYLSHNKALHDEGIGIDLGVKNFAVMSNGKVYRNINKSARLKKLEKQLAREQKCLSRKYENGKKGGATQLANIQKQKRKVQKLHHRIDNIRTDYINKIIAETVKTKPSYIAIEDLNVSGMMRNRHLSKAVASQKFYEFRAKLKNKCDAKGIELRIVDRWYPSSKMCHCCGNVKKDLKLSDRRYRCSCGYIEDRDFNASLNLRDAKYVPKAISGIYDCGVYKNLPVACLCKPQKHTP